MDTFIRSAGKQETMRHELHELARILVNYKDRRERRD